MQHLPASFFLQMAAILLTCRVVGWLGRKIGQPPPVYRDFPAADVLHFFGATPSWTP